MDCAIHSTATQQRSVCGVNDGVHLKPSDIGSGDLDSFGASLLHDELKSDYGTILDNSGSSDMSLRANTKNEDPNKLVLEMLIYRL